MTGLVEHIQEKTILPLNFTNIFTYLHQRGKQLIATISRRSKPNQDFICAFILDPLHLLHLYAFLLIVTLVDTESISPNHHRAIVPSYMFQCGFQTLLNRYCFPLLFQARFRCIQHFQSLGNDPRRMTRRSIWDKSSA